MCTVQLTYDNKNARAREMLATMISSGLFYIDGMPEKNDRVYIENGEVKLDFLEETTDLESFRKTLHDMVELEYSLPWGTRLN